MHQDRQAACWGSFPRRQRRLPRSRLFARRMPSPVTLTLDFVDESFTLTEAGDSNAFTFRRRD